MKRVHPVSQICFFLLALVIPFLICKAELCADTVKVSAGKADIDVVPDLYNTGPQIDENMLIKPDNTSISCKLEEEASTLEVVFSGKPGAYSYAVNFAYKNEDVNGYYIFENTDFSDHDFTLLGTDAIAKNGRNVTFEFRNCKFKSFAGTRWSVDNLSLIFDYCSFVSVQGSNSVFNHCRFGGGVSDRMNLFVDCDVNDSYIYNPTRESDKDGVHIDGIQIYGYESSVTGDIHYNNCRFEMPAIKYPGAPNANVNACIMVQTEYSDGDNITFENCYLNGGGYSMYVHGCKGTKLSNVVLKDLHFGCAARYGRLYPDRPDHDDVEWNEDTWDDATTLYVGTVTRNQQAKVTSICVSNDTNQNRNFKIYTSNGNNYLFSIEACPLYREFSERKMEFSDLPFDRLYEIPEYCDWVVVCDVTNEPGSLKPLEKVIRFQNWTSQKEIQYESTQTVNMEYAISNGTLNINILGDMPEFEQGKYPWSPYSSEVKKIVVTGADSIAPYAFYDFSNLETVELNDKVRSIGRFSFANCPMLTDINLSKLSDLWLIDENAFENCVSFSDIGLPRFIREIRKNAFNVDLTVYNKFDTLRNVYYDGTVNQWMHVTMANAASNPMSVKGGVLYANKNKITVVDMASIGETVVGANAFCGCVSLEKFVPGDVKRIGANAFSATGLSGVLIIPKTVESLGGGSFAHCEQITKIIYDSSVNIPNNAFVSDTNLEEIAINGQVVQLKNNCLANCPKLTKVLIPDSVSLIGRAAFQNCSGLGEITVPKGVTELVDYAFDGCEALRKIVFEGEQCPIVYKHSFSGVDSQSLVVIYPEASTEYENNSILKSVCCKFETFKEPEPTEKPTEEPTPVYTTAPFATASPETSPTILPSPSEYVMPTATPTPEAMNTPKPKVTPTPKISQSSIKRLVNQKRYSLYVSWKKLAKSKISGYEIQYSTSSLFKKCVKTKKISSPSKGAVKLTKLSKNKKYYVRIRTYKSIKGKKYYSKWSAKKSVKIKK